MADVALADRRAVRFRDGERCVSCGAVDGLTMQHRAAVGMGGTSFRVGLAGLLTACAVCNGEYEHTLQDEALVYGWKIRSWVTAHIVPVFYMHRRIWVVLGAEGRMRAVPSGEAVLMMRAAYGEQWEAWARDLRVLVGLEGMK